MKYRKCVPTIVLLLGLTTSWAHPQATQENEEERIKPVPGVNLSYTGYYSALTKTNTIESKRMAGARWGVFLPQKQLEIGAFFQRLLQDERFNSVGLDAAWQAPWMPLVVRMEYARNGEGSGYWVEAAYRLHRVGFWRPLLRRSQVVFRAEQFFAPSHIDEIAHHEDGHPGDDHDDLAFSVAGHDQEDPHEDGLGEEDGPPGACRRFSSGYRSRPWSTWLWGRCWPGRRKTGRNGHQSGDSGTCSEDG